MSKYLCKTVETYRVDTEEEANFLIEDNKNQTTFELIKYSSEYKTRKSKGEIIDEYFKITLEKSFCDIKEPDRRIKAVYQVDDGYGTTFD